MLKTKGNSIIFGDVGAKKWSQKFRLGTQSAILGHLKKGTFGKSAQIWNKKNCTLSAQMKILRPLFNSNIPQK